MIFSDDEYIQCAEQVEADFSRMFPSIETRYAFPIVANTSTYSLPSDLISVRRITWNGRRIEPLPARQQRAYFQGTAATGAPMYYLYSEIVASRLIRFFPTPNISVTASGNLYGAGINPGLVMSYWSLPDYTTKIIPVWLRRRVIKAGALAKLYLKEGPGQNLIAAKYYSDKFVAQANMNGQLIDYSAAMMILQDRQQWLFRYPAGPIYPVDQYGIGVDEGE